MSNRSSKKNHDTSFWPEEKENCQRMFTQRSDSAWYYKTPVKVKTPVPSLVLVLRVLKATFLKIRQGTQQFEVYKFPEKGRGWVRLWAGHRPSLSRFMAVRPSQQTSKYIGQIRRRLEHFCSIRGHKGDLSTNKSPYAPTVLRSGPLSNTDRKLNPLKSLWWHRGENRDLMKSLPSSRVGNIS